MPRRSTPSAAERNSLLEIPSTQNDLIRRYAFSERDLSIIRQHRKPENRLGFAVHLCYMRYPGVILGAEEAPCAALLRLVANQIDAPMEIWESYAQRAETRREHLLELQAAFGFATFTTTRHYLNAIESLDDLSWQTDKGIVLASTLVEGLHQQKVLLPTPEVIDRICAESITRANRRIYAALTDVLTVDHRHTHGALHRSGVPYWLHSGRTRLAGASIHPYLPPTPVSSASATAIMSATARDSLTPASPATRLIACICSGCILILILVALIFLILLLTYYPGVFLRRFIANYITSPYVIVKQCGVLFLWRQSG